MHVHVLHVVLDANAIENFKVVVPPFLPQQPAKGEESKP